MIVRRAGPVLLGVGSGRLVDVGPQPLAGRHALLECLDAVRDGLGHLIGAEGKVQVGAVSEPGQVPHVRGVVVGLPEVADGQLACLPLLVEVQGADVHELIGRNVHHIVMSTLHPLVGAIAHADQLRDEALGADLGEVLRPLQRADDGVVVDGPHGVLEVTAVGALAPPSVQGVQSVGELLDRHGGELVERTGVTGTPEDPAVLIQLHPLGVASCLGAFGGLGFLGGPLGDPLPSLLLILSGEGSLLPEPADPVGDEEHDQAEEVQRVGQDGRAPAVGPRVLGLRAAQGAVEAPVLEALEVALVADGADGPRDEADDEPEREDAQDQNCQVLTGHGIIPVCSVSSELGVELCTGDFVGEPKPSPPISNTW